MLDLGCGTGQLAVPLASRVGSVIGMDPEPDMLRLARDTAARHDVRNATWVLGADSDVPALSELMGQRSLAMAVIGQALHWMDHGEERLWMQVEEEAERQPLLTLGEARAVVHLLEVLSHSDGEGAEVARHLSGTLARRLPAGDAA